MFYQIKKKKNSVSLTMFLKLTIKIVAFFLGHPVYVGLLSCYPGARHQPFWSHFKQICKSGFNSDKLKIFKFWDYFLYSFWTSNSAKGHLTYSSVEAWILCYTIRTSIFSWLSGCIFIADIKLFLIHAIFLPMYILIIMQGCHWDC